jgi:hypothetical protein
MSPQTFDESVETACQNLGLIAVGEARPSTAPWPRPDKVVVTTPYGSPIVAFPLVEADTARVASMIVSGDQAELDDSVTDVRQF